MRFILSLLALLAIGLVGPASAQVGCIPNPNLNTQLSPTPGFVDGCPLPATGLNNTFGAVNTITTQQAVTIAALQAQINGFQQGLTSVQSYGAAGSNLSTTGSVSLAAPTTLTVVNTQDFKVGQGIFVLGAGAPYGGSPETVSLVANSGGGATTTYWYAVAPVDSLLGVGPASSPTSVSGSVQLGTPLDLKTQATANSHSNTTIDNINQTSCTMTTCIVVGSTASGPGVPNNDTVVTVNSATSVTLATATNTTVTGGAFSFTSPTGGNDVVLTITGTNPARLIYQGTTAGNLTCIGYTDLNTWNDYGIGNGSSGGATHYRNCPTWAPATPPSGTQNDALETTIKGINLTNMLTISPGASTTVTGAYVSHDDTTALKTAFAAAVPLVFGCGNYNILQGISITSSGTYNGLSCATLWGWGVMSTMSILAGADTSTLLNLNINGTQHVGGDELHVNGLVKKLHIDNVDMTDPYNMLYVTSTAGFAADGITADKVIGDYGVQLVASDAAHPATHVVGTTLNRFNIGPCTNCYGFWINGNISTIEAHYIVTKDGPFEFRVDNAIGSNTGPQFASFDGLQINLAWGTPFKMDGGGGQYRFSNLYDQGQAGNGQPGVRLTNNVVGPVIIDSMAVIFNHDKEGVFADNFQLYMGDASDLVYNNSQSNIGMYARVNLGADMINARIHLATGNHAGGNESAGIPTAGCGIHFTAGFGTSGIVSPSPAGITDFAAPGLTAPVCIDDGQTGAIYDVDGNVQPALDNITASSNQTIPASAMIGSGGQNSWVFRSGSFSGGFTDTTATLAQLNSQYGNSYAGFQWQMTIYNLSNKTETLAGGSNVTIAGTATTASMVQHVFTCVFTAAAWHGTPTGVTCSG